VRLIQTVADLIGSALRAAALAERLAQAEADNESSSARQSRSTAAS
jgi:hypothetical protein